MRENDVIKVNHVSGPTIEHKAEEKRISIDVLSFFVDCVCNDYNRNV